SRPELPTGASAIIVGGQGENVRLSSSDVKYDVGAHLFSAAVTVENLILQALGTEDGETEAAEGVRVFYHSLPAVTGGEGVVAVANADGHDLFTGTGQPYDRYEMLEAGQVSAPRTWTWAVPETVESFDFSFFVSAPVQYPDGWIE